MSIDRLERVATALAVAGSAAYLFVYLGTALARLRYPFELEWMEGGMVEHVRRVLEGKSLYAKPSLEFVSFLYPPGYYYASAVVSAITGPGFLPLRLLSFLSSIGVLALLGALARKETGSWASGLTAAGLFAATYEKADGWLDLARLDSFYLAVLLFGVVLLRHGRGRGSGFASGLLLAAAFLTKQSAIVVVLPLVAYAVLVERRRGLAAGAALIALGSGTVLAINHFSQGWFAYYVFELPARHPRIPGGALWFWTRDLLPALWLALLPALWAMAGRLRAGAERTRLFLPVLFASLVASSWSVRSVYGAEVNNLLPAFAAVALLAAVAAWDVRRGLPALVATFAVAGQLALLAYDPRPLVPSAADRSAGDRLVRRLAATDGEIFVPHHGYLARLAGKGVTAHTLAMDNVFLDDPGPARRDLEDEVVRALAERRYGAALVESDGRYAPWILAGYDIRERLFDRTDVFWPVSGGRLRPEALALPR